MSRLCYEDYIIEILERIEEFDINDFKNFIVKLALEKDSSERQNYLEFIDEVLLEKSKTFEKVKSDLNFRKENDDIELVDDVMELYNQVEDGEYKGCWEWDPEYHKERMMGDESWAEEAAELFLRTEAVCKIGQYEVALKSYEKLFNILSNEELSCHEDYESMLDIDLGKQRNLFLLCVYFCNNLEERPEKILDVINHQGYIYRKEFRLSNLIEASFSKLPEFHKFTKLFITILSNRDDSLYKDLLIDTIFSDGGIKGIKDFASENYQKYPEAYLFLLKKLKEELAEDDKIIGVCEEALLKIERNNKIRDPIAKIMIESALNLDKSDAVMTGIKEAFYSNPQIENIVLMIEYGRKYNCNENENIVFATERLMELIEVGSSSESRGYYSNIEILTKVILHKLYLLSGQIIDAFKMALETENKDCYKSEILDFTRVFLLILLSKDNNEHSNIIRGLLDEKIDNLGINKDIRQKFVEMIFQNIHKASVSEVEAKQYMEWCIHTTKKQINEIVSNQYRGQYDEAAQELIACAEMIANVKGETEAYNFIIRIKALYPRHTSFTKSVNSVLRQSNI